MGAATGRIIYAANDGNWMRKRGAVSQGNKAGIDSCVWNIEVNEYGFIFINIKSERVLYAQVDKNWQEGVGAGRPRNNVHDDGIWQIIPADEEMTAENKNTL